MFRLTGIRQLLTMLALPLLILIAAVPAILGIGRNVDRSAKEVAEFIKNFLEGKGGEWDWDDFTSVPIRDPLLESIRCQANMVQLPITDAGYEELRDLLRQAEKIVTLDN